MNQNKEFDNLFINSLSESLDPVSGYANKLLGQMIPFVRLVKKWDTKESLEKGEKLLLQILEIYSELQCEIFDVHIQKIFKWWIPQAAEILALIQTSFSKEMTKSVENVFCLNSVKALFLLTGEYLIFESDAWPKNSDDGNRDAQFNAIKEKCNLHTDSLRKLLLISFKSNSKVNNESSQFDDTSYNNSRNVMRINSLPESKRTCSNNTWSQTSGDQSVDESSEDVVEESFKVSFFKHYC